MRRVISDWYERLTPQAQRRMWQHGWLADASLVLLGINGWAGNEILPFAFFLPLPNICLWGGDRMRSLSTDAQDRAFVVAWCVIGLLTFLCLIAIDVAGTLCGITCLVAIHLGIDDWSQFNGISAPPLPPSTIFGSAHWGTLDYMRRHNLVGEQGLMLGIVPDDYGFYRLRYAGDRHLLTIAPTGSGKGTTAIIPNLLTYEGSCIVVDPKAENAMISGTTRERMGQDVHVVDPWHIGDRKAARFNPLDWLTVGDLDIAGNAMMIADALIVSDGKGDSFWAEEAKALLQGLILYVATDPDEKAQRHLGRVRDLLLLDGVAMPALFRHMLQSPHHVVASTGARCLQKEEKLLANVVASAQAQTHFLESPHLRESLSASDFRFEDLKTRPMTVYLVLPADRLGTFGRWLRLLIQQALTVTCRDIENKPDKPVLFVLDEMPSLGRLAMVEQAFGLMRGFGIQLWAIVQDAGQLKRIYGESWETFVANAGAVTYHGSRDKVGADYFSDLCGVATVLNFGNGSSHSTTFSNDGRSVTSGTSYSFSYAQRKLIFPDELMRLDHAQQLVLIENHPPALVRKVPWFEDPGLRALGRNLYLERQANDRRLSQLSALEAKREPALPVVRDVL